MHEQHAALEQAAEQQAERARALELENQKLVEERDLARREWEREREAAEEALRISQAKLDEATLAHEEYTHRAMAEMERYRQQVEDERLDVEEHIKASVSEQTERQRAPCPGTRRSSSQTRGRPQRLRRRAQGF